MSKFTKLIKRFHRDQSGAFAIMFAVSSVTLIAMGGAAVDFVSIDQARSRAQQALDAATLSLQQDIYQSNAKNNIQSKAEKLLIERVGKAGENIKIDKTTISTQNGSLYLQASLDVPLYFVALLGIKDAKVVVESQAIRQKQYLEVAFVLDNSGSMGSSGRMTNLKAATRTATKILFYGGDPKPAGAKKSDKTKVAIVPFDHFVNVGIDNKDALWMDQKGASKVSRENFDDDDNENTKFKGRVNRFALYDALQGTSWEGCVEARRGNLSINDTPPNTKKPNTLFVPVFAPDNPDDGWNFSNNYIKDDGGSCKNNPKLWTLSDREAQERLCKYANAKPLSYKNGPNADCVKSPILPLTDDIENLGSFDKAITGMQPSGYTNIHQGVIWGLRTLSPSAPFKTGRPYDPDTSKVLIVMTDGDNTFRTSNNMNQSSHLSAYGHRWTKRLGYGVTGVNANKSPRDVMNQLTIKSCESAKKLGMSVYTVGLSASSSNKKMLTACASSKEHAFFPKKAADLNGVFKEIAGELSALRIQY